MAKLQLRVVQKCEIEGSPLTYAIKMAAMALTTDAGAIIRPASGEFTIDGLLASQINNITTGTVFNCPIQT